MGGFRKILDAGVASGALIAALATSAWAATDTQTYTVAPGQTQTVSTAIVNPSSTTDEAVVLTGGGTLALTSTANTYSGGTTVEGGSTLNIAADANLGATGSIVVLGDQFHSGTLAFTNTTAFTTARDFTLSLGNGVIDTGPVANTISGTISGIGKLTIVGNVGTVNELSLTGTNSYTGGTVVKDATVELSADAALGGASGALKLNNGTVLFNASTSLSRNITMTARGATFDTNTYSDTIEGSFTSTAGTLTKTGTGTLTLNDSAYASSVNVTAGALEVGDGTTNAVLTGNVTLQSGTTLDGVGTIAANETGTVSGSVTNTAGVVAPGTTAGTALTVGEYTQGSAGTLAIAAGSAGLSELKVTGAANIAGTLTINYGTATVPLNSYTVLSAGALTGKFATVDELGLSLGYKQAVDYNGNNVDVVLTQQSTLPEKATIYGAATTAAVDETDAATGSVLQRLTETRSDALIDSMRMGTTETHSANSGISNWPYGAWFHGTGGFGDLNGSGSAPGFGTSGGGFMAGIDGQFDRGFAAGIAVGYDRLSVGERGGANATISTPRAALYAGWWRGIYAIDGTLQFGIGNVSAGRPIAGVGSADSSYTSDQISAAIQGSATFKVAGLALIPQIGAKYVYADQKSFSEAGGGIYDLSGGSKSVNSVKPYIGGSLAGRFKFDRSDSFTLVPELHVAYEREVSSLSRNTIVQVAGDQANFTMLGLPEPRSDIDVKAGLMLETSRDLSFYAGYEAIRGTGIVDQSVNVGLVYRIGA